MSPTSLISKGRVRRAGIFAVAMTAAAGALLAATAGSSAAAVGAVPPANARAEVVTQFGGEILRYTGLNAANTVSLDLLGGRYRITDTAPITAGTGCLVAKAVPGQFAVLCKAPTTANGSLQTVRIDTAGGNDVVTNRTAARVRIDGGTGNDTLIGGPANDLLTDSQGADRLVGNGGGDSLFTDGPADSAPDVLDGGTGDDDLRANAGSDRLLGGDGSDVLRGGLGADDLDGGLGLDSVSYLENGHGGVRLVVSIDNVADDGARTLGATANEGDNVRRSNEIVEGNSGNDVIFGNELSNTLRGQLGNDVLIGGRGADLVEGGPGDDQLASNDLFGVPVADGSIDTLNGGDGTDYCRVPFFAVETDILISCENVNQD